MVALISLNACASLPRAPVVPADDARRKPKGIAADTPPQGELRPGDLLVLTLTHGDNAYEMIGPVDATGNLHVGHATDVDVAGLTLQTAQQRVAERLRQRDRLLQVDLRISDRPNQRVSVLGALTRPGYLDLGKGMRVTDLVAAAGGLRSVTEGRGNEGETGVFPIADLADGALLRDGRALPIDLEAAMRGEPGHNVFIYPGDQLYVPFATDDVVSVLGQVNLPGAFVHRKGLRLTEALAAAGGITVGGDKGDIRVVRGTPEAPIAYTASLRAMVKQKSRDVTLTAGDVVFVTDDPLEDMGEVLLELVVPIASIGLSIVSAYALVQNLEAQRLARQLSDLRIMQMMATPP